MKTITNLNRFLATVVLTVVSTVAGWAIYQPSINWDENTKTITITHSDADVTIYYTVDGTTPTKNSYLYTAPFTVNRNLDIRAIAVKGDDVSSYSWYDVDVDSRSQIGGICYRRIDNTFDNVVEVCSPMSGRYEGDITIQPSITLANVTYQVTRIGNGAFNDNNNITSVTIPNSVTTIGNYAFYDCDRLTSISLPPSIKKIEYNAFRECHDLRSVTLSNGLETIEYGVFYNCYNLQNVSLPSTLTTIGDEAFQSCRSFTRMELPDGLTVIGHSLLESCSNMASVKLPATLTAIPNEMFYNCTSLRSVSIPSTVKSIGANAFRNCDGLTSIVIPDGVESLGNYVFFDCNNLLSATIGEGVTTIPYCAFDDDYALSVVSLPSTLLTIGERAFNTCRSLTSITIPENVTSIASQAFTECDKLTSIYCMPLTPPTIGSGESNPFFDAVDRATLYVKSTAMPAYQALEQWDLFPNKVVFDQQACAQPTFALADYVLTMSTTTADATIYYTTDGTEPTTGSTQYTAPIPFLQNGTVKAIAVKDGMDNSNVSEFVKSNYTVPTPVVTMDENFVVTFSCESPNIENFPETSYYYTINGEQWNYTVEQAPNWGWQLWDGQPIQMEQPGYMHVFAERDGWVKSSPQMADYYNSYRTTKPWMEWVSDKQKLRIYNYDNDATVYYTLDGSDPTKDSYVYNPEDSIFIDHNLTVKCIAMCSGRFNSQIATTTITNATAKFVLGDITYRRIDNSTALEIEVTSNPNGGKKYSGDVVIPSTVTNGDNTYTVTRIGEGAFYQCSELTNISLPSTVTSIGKHAFYGANKLKEIEFKGSKISLDYGAFEECSQLKDVIFRGQLTKLDEHSFYRCRSLESITLPSGLTRIEASSFYEDTKLKSISIPEGVTYLGQSVFYGCSSLTTIQLPSTLEKMDHHAFQNSGLQSIVIPDNVTYMGEEVFHDCYSLNSVTLPAKLETLGNYAFYECRSLRSISLPESLKTLNYRTFWNCYALTTVQLPSTLTTIGERAFENCSTLRTITLPESVNNIGSYAFYGCSALESVYALPTTPPTVTNEFAFAGQINTATLYVKSSTLNDYKSNINWCQFYTIKSIDQVPAAQPTFSFDVTNYKLSILSQDANATIYYTRDNSEPTAQSTRYTEPIPFMQNDTVKAIAISEGLAPSVVSEYRKNDFTVPVPVCSMDENFLVTITCEQPAIEGFPQPRIYYLLNTSYYDVSLTDTNWQLYDGEPIQLSQPKFVHVYADCDGWITSSQTYANYFDPYYTRRPDMYWHADKLKLELYNYDADATVYYTLDGSDPTEQSLVYNPADSIAISRNVLVKCIAMRPGHFNSTINECQITGVNQTFSKDGIYYRIIDNTLANEVEVTHGDKNYEGDIVIPESFKYAGVDYAVTRIGRDAFYDDDGLTNVTMPKSIVAIGINAFYHCDGLSSIVIPEGVKIIESDAFCHCPNLQKVTFPETLETIEYQAFNYCVKLNNFELPSKLKTIGEEAFRDCDMITSVTIPESVTTIGTNAFWDCSRLESATLPSGLTELAVGIFQTTPIKSLVIPSGVTTIGWRAFYDCTSLNSVVMPTSLTTIAKEVFSNCNSLTSISIPEGVTAIEEYTFKNCNHLTTVQLPSSLKTISFNAFENCSSMPTLTLPENLKSIDVYAFKDCSALTSIYSLAVEPPTLNGDGNSNAFATVLGKATLYVKNDAMEKYENANIWSSFSRASFDEVPCAQPTFTLENFRLTMKSNTAGATIYYTTDNSEPTTQSAKYTEPILLLQNDTIRAFAVAEGFTPSLVSDFRKEDYKVPTVTAEINDETFVVTLNVEIPNIDGFPQTKIYYIENNDSWWEYSTIAQGNSDWKLYEAPIQLTEPRYVHVYAVREGWIDSSTGVYNYSSDYSTTTPSLQWVSDKQKVHIYNYDEDATVYYTLDGSDPTEQSMVYNPADSIFIDHNLTVKCIAMRPKHFNSQIASSTITGVTNTFVVGDLSYRRIDNNAALEVEVTTNPVGKKYMGDIDIPSEVTYAGTTYTVVGIGENAFKDCTELTSITLAPTITSIGTYAFYNVNQLKSIEFKSPQVSIGWGAFESCKQLKEVTFHGKLTMLDPRSFRYCSALESIVIPRGLSRIEGSSFAGCTSLKNVAISEDVVYIGEQTFEDCSSLTNVQLPSTLEKIDHWAFKQSGLQSIVIPDNVTFMGTEIFRDCSRLTSVTMPAKLETLNNEAFYNCTSLRSISLPEGFKTLNYRTFYGCNALTTVQLPSTLTTIGQDAFRGCSSLRTITIPESVARIDAYAFLGCPSIESVYALPTTPPTVPADASFAFTQNLSTATLFVKPEAKDAYNNHTVWAQFDKVEAITQIPSGQPTFVFDGTNYKLSIVSQDANAVIYYTRDNSEPTAQSTRYTEPIAILQNDTVKAIAISEGLAPSLVSEFRKNDFKVPTPTAEINDETFVVTVSCETPDIEGIPETKFYYCLNDNYYYIDPNSEAWQLLEGNTIELNSPKYLHLYAVRDGWVTSEQTYFDYYSNYRLYQPQIYYNSSDHTVSLTHYNSVASDFYYTLDGSEPSKDNGTLYTEPFVVDRNYIVKAVAVMDKHFNSTVSSYEISGVSTTFLADGIYYRLRDMTTNDEVEVTGVPEGIANYSGNITIPSSVSYNNKVYAVTGIYNSAFSGSSIKSISLPEGLQVIRESAFYSCQSLTEIEIPSTVEEIGYQAFYNCYKMDKVTLHEGLKTIGSSAFSYCKQLGTIALPNTLTSIGSSTFSECSGLTSITWPASVITIENGMFHGCVKLADVTLPSTLTEIKPNTFYNCSSLTALTLPEGLTSIGSEAFYGCNALTSIIIPNGVKKIESGTFYYCYSLVSVSLPAQLTEIASQAFYNCYNLSSLTLPANLTKIGSSAFAYCGEITSIYAQPATPPTAENGSGMSSLYDKATLYVLPASMTAYSEAPYWSQFKTISEFTKLAAEQPAFVYQNYKLTMSTITAGGFIYYTRDGSDPTTQSLRYTEPLIFTQNDTVRAITVAEDMENSRISEFRKNDFKVAQPQSTLDEETFQVTITCETPEAEGMPETRIWYAINQSYYTPESSQYQLYDGEPIQMTKPGYIHLYAERDGWETSDRRYDNFYDNYRLDEPYLSWDSEQKLMTITQSNADAIYYTIDGSEPSKENGTLYTEPFTLPRNLIVKAVAVKDKHFNSNIREYTVSNIDATFMVDGIMYRLADNTLENIVEVTSGSEIKEVIDIPETIDHNDVQYTVVGIRNSAFSGRSDDSNFTRKYVIPKTVKSIGDRAFYDNYYVEEIELNEGLETIGYYAFGFNYSLSEIYIPSTVVSMGDRAFYNDSWRNNDLNIYCCAKTPEIQSYTFGGRTGAATLYVYENYLDDFKNADYWKDFAKIETFSKVPVAKPRFSFDMAKFKLAITTPTNGATIYYTRDGSDPTTNSLVYTDSLIFTQNDTVRAMAVKDGMDYSLISEFKKNDFKVAAPVATIDNETFQVTITCETPEAEGMPETRIWYVIDQSTWNRSEGFTLYDGEPIQMTEPGYIHMYAERDGWIMSDQRYDDFYSNYRLTTPSISWDSETKKFTLSHDDNEVSFYYTLDGSQPTKENGLLYSEPVTLVRNLVIKAIATKDAHFNSAVREYTVTDVDSRFMYDGLAYRLVDNTTEDVVEVTSGGNVSGKFAIPEKVNDTAGKTYTVVRIGDSAFYGEHDITDVTLPESIQSIGNRAFFGCSLLTIINLPDALTEIGSEAFDGADLSSIVVPGGVKKLSERAFRYNQNAKSVVLKSGVEEIGDYAFAYVGMQNLELPSTLTKIGNSAFWRCDKLLSVNIPDGVTVLEGTTFESCSALETVILPSTLSHIKHSAFNGCSSLVSVILPESLKIIEDGAFINCVSLGHVYSLAVTPPSIDSGDAPFAGVADHAILYVKPQSETIYSQTPNWGAFSKIETFENLPCEKPIFAYDNYHLTMTSQTEGVNIYYTLDGTEPTTSSLLYKEPVAIAKNDTILAMAISDDWGRSLTSEWKKSDLQVANPTASISEDFMVTVTCEEPEVEGLPQTRIYYSLNRSSWNGGADEDWKLYTEPLKLTVANYLHVRAERDGWIKSGQSDYNYYSDYYLEKPFISPSNTSISYMPKDSTITIIHDDPEAQLYYTLDGSDPNEGGILYTAPFNPGHNVKVTAIAKREGRISSDPDQREYKWFTVATPKVSIEHLAAVITTERPSSTTIYYTLDNTAPTRESKVYTEPIALDKNCTIRTMAVADDWNDSPENSFDFYTRDYTVGTPQFSPLEYGSVSESADSTLTITTTTEDAVIYYTLDGTTPTIQSAKYEGPVKLMQNCTVKALAVKTDLFNSVISEAPINWFTVKTPRITFNGKYTSIETETPGTAIYYTTDNSEPDAKSKVYVEPFVLPAEQTVLKAIAIREGWNNSSVMERTYNPGLNYCEAPVLARVSGTDQVQMTSRTENAVIYYTTDGTLPTTSSLVYDGTPVTMTHNTTLTAMTTQQMLYDSETTTFQVNWFKVDQPVITSDGIYVNIDCAKEGARIFYTLDGTDPTEESQQYTKTLVMTGSCTIKAIATYDDFNNSSVARLNYSESENTTATPEFAHEGNMVTIDSESGEGTVIYYTTDGTEPTAQSTVYTAPVEVAENCTIKAIAKNAKLFVSAVGSYNVDWFKAETPVIAFDGITMSISSATPQTTIYYTLDGSTPDETSLQYTTPVVMTGTCTIKAMAVRSNFNNSSVATSLFEVSQYTTAAPIFRRDGDIVTLQSETEGSTTIYYTMDGTEPTTASEVYSQPLTMTENVVLKALAVNPKLFTSAVSTYEVNWFKVNAPEVVFDGIFVTMTTSTPDARIYYSLDGTTPTEESLRYTGTLTMTQTCTVKAIGIKENFNNSSVVTNMFDKDANTVGIPRFNRNGNVLSITTETTVDGTNIYYTTDGSEPSAESQKYEGAFEVMENQTIKALALNAKLFTSEVATYDVDWFKAATPVLTLSGNTLTMSCTTPDAVIYYEYDEAPTTKSAVYSAPITLVDNRMVYAMAVKNNFHDSEVATVAPDLFVCTQPTFAYNGRYLQIQTGENMDVHYTLDGSKPTEDSEVYDGQIEIKELCTVRAIAMRRDFRDSPEASYTVSYVYTGEDASQMEAGHLADMFQWVGGADNVENLPVSGKINDADLAFIRSLKSLRHLDLTDAVYEGSKLPDEAFANMPLLTFQSPKQLSAVGDHLFRGCDQLAAIVWNANLAIPETVTEDVKGNANFLLYVNSRIHVPSSYTGNIISGGQATSITLTDAGSGNFCCPQRFFTNRISYTHTYSQTTESGVTCGWETLALPFDVQSITHERRGAMAPFSAQEDYSLYKPFWLYELQETGFSDATEVKAYTPYIISMPNNPNYADDFILAGKVTFSAADTYIEVDTAMVTMKGSVRFAPAMQRQEKSSSVLAINLEDCTVDGIFYRSGSAFLPNLRRVNPFEAYALVGASVPKIPLVDMEWGYVTDMRNAQMSELEAIGRKGGVYDLLGRKLSNDSSNLKNDGGKMKRVYIINGKKTVVE